jgi:hypothetical protein
MKNLLLTVFLVGSAGMFSGCMSMSSSGNNGQVQSYPAPVIEAAWIRNGEPITYDGRKWYPANDFETLDDSEVFQIGEYKDVQIFVEKIATKPYDRIYTKFDKGKFRYWELKDNDQS